MRRNKCTRSDGSDYIESIASDWWGDFNRIVEVLDWCRSIYIDRSLSKRLNWRTRHKGSLLDSSQHDY